MFDEKPAAFSSAAQAAWVAAGRSAWGRPFGRPILRQEEAKNAPGRPAETAVAFARREPGR